MQDFVIPVKPEGLLRSHEEHCYTVEEELNVRSLSQKDITNILNGMSSIEWKGINVTRLNQVWSCVSQASRLMLQSMKDLIRYTPCYGMLGVPLSMFNGKTIFY